MSNANSKSIIYISIPGLISLLLLIFIMSPENFYDWIFDKTILYTIFFFFYVPIANIVTNFNYKKEHIIIITIGLLLFIPYSIIMNLTLYDVVVTFLQTIVVLSIYSSIFRYVENKIEKGTKWMT